MNRLDHKTIERICDLRELGHTIASISSDTGASLGGVDWHLTKLAIDPPKTTFTTWDDGIRGPAVMKRRGSKNRRAHIVRRFTPFEDSEILRLQALGDGYCAIGRALNRAA